MNIGEKIKLVRGDQSLGEFADKLSTADYKVYKSNIKKYEDSAVVPTTEFYKRIAEVFNVNLNWLISNKGAMYLERYIQRSAVNKSIKSGLAKKG